MANSKGNKSNPVKQVRELSVQATRSFAGFHRNDTFIVAEDDPSWKRVQSFITSGYLRVLGDTETVDVLGAVNDGEVRAEHTGDPGNTGAAGGAESASAVSKD